MTRSVSILHRKPRGRRERMLARFRGVRDDAHRRWRRLRHRQAHRADHARVQRLFLQLSHTARAADEPVVEKSHNRRLRDLKR